MVLFDALVENFSVFAFELGVAFGRCFVNVDFPADATGISAFASDATERIIKIRNTKKHEVKIGFYRLDSRKALENQLKWKERENGYNQLLLLYTG
jgi:hypothetical protein